MLIKLFNAFVKITAFPVQWAVFRTKVYYEDKSAQSRRIKGAAVLVSNHTSVWDYACYMFVFFFRTLRTQMALERGGVVEIYPESRLPLKGEERPLPFKPGAAYLALLSGAPIITAFTNGAYFSKKRARVIIGKPLYARDLIDPSLSEKENIERVSNLTRDKIISLEKQLYDKQKR